MPLAPYTHDEPGENWIVETPNREFTGKRLGVTFLDGVGYTPDIWTARRLSDEFNYDVIGYTGAERWDEATPEPEVKPSRPAAKSMKEALAAMPKGQFEPSTVPAAKRQPLGKVPD
jgi:hypothetical protein